MDTIRLTTIYDNYSNDEKLRTGWGFSCWVEVGDLNLLFDAGADRAIEMFNLKHAGCEPKTVQGIFLSHLHPDHYGGITGVTESAKGLRIFLGKSTPRNYRKQAQEIGGMPVMISGPTRLFENVFSTGELNHGFPEQSLILRSEKGLVVITGCSHPGVLKIAERAMSQLEGRIHLLLGGFHLNGKSGREILAVIEGLQAMGVEKVAPCHCSGDLARELFCTSFRNNYIPNGVGRRIEI